MLGALGSILAALVVAGGPPADRPADDAVIGRPSADPMSGPAEPGGESAPVASSPDASSTVASSTVGLRVRVRERAPRDPTLAVTTIDAERLERSRARGDGLADVITRAPGAFVTDEGGPLRTRRLRLRGGTPLQTAVFVDGVALSTPFATGVDLALIGLGSVSRVRILRGPAGVLVGDGALAGAVWIEGDPDPRPWRVGLRVGALGTAGLEVGVRSEGLSLSAEVDRTDARFPYVSRLEGLPDEARTRTNNDASRLLVALTERTSLAGGALVLSAQAALREAGVPGLETQSSETAREARAQGLARAAWRCGSDCAAVPVEVALSATALDVRFDDQGGPLAASQGQFLALGALVTVEPTVGPHRLRAEASGGVELADLSPGSPVQRGRLALALTDVWRLDPVVISAGLRAAAVLPGTFALLPRLGAEWRVRPDLVLMISGGRGLRAPTIDELYHPLENGLAGNPGLIPESAWEGELRARAWPLVGVQVEVAAFARSVLDTIAYVNRDAFVVRPENLGDSTAVGGELELSVTRTLGALTDVEVHAAMSLARTELTASGAALPGAPLWGGELELDLAPHFSERRPIELFTRVNLASSSTANASGTLSVRPYACWDAGVTWRLPAGLSVALAVRNLLDVSTLETLQKLPLPGRTWTGTLRWVPEAT